MHNFSRRIIRGLWIFLPLSTCVVYGQQPAPPPLVSAQPAPSPNDTLTSPEVRPDRHVIFRIYAPDAQRVLVQSEGPESTPGMTAETLKTYFTGVPLTKADNGVWSVDLGVIQPGIYRYNYVVDGVATTDPRNPLSSETLLSVKSMYEVPGAAFLEDRTNILHGAVSSVFYYSNVLGTMRRMHVYTPPGYSASASGQLPVLYLLHGGGDSDDSWPTVGAAGLILDNLIASGEAVPMIVVMPAGHISRSFHISPQSGHDMFHDKFNDDLVQVIVPYIDKNYRVKADRDDRAIAGLSMGGAQTLTTSMEHSDLFAYVGVFSSGWFHSMMDEIRATDIAGYKKTGQPFRLYWTSVGKQDIALSNSNETVTELQKAGIKTDSHLTKGFHAWNNWRDNLHSFAPLLFRDK